GPVAPVVPPPAAATPPAGEPTIYVPPRVTRPADRVPVAPPPRRGPPHPATATGDRRGGTGRRPGWRAGCPARSGSRPPPRPAGPGPAGPAPRRGPAAPRDRDEGQPWWIWLLAVLAVVLLGAIGFLAAQLLGEPPGPTPEPSAAQVTVPECEDVALTALRSAARDADLVVETESEPSDDIEQGRVIRCDPASGTQVDEGSTLIVYVSSGADSVPVPRLRGQTLD